MKKQKFGGNWPSRRFIGAYKSNEEILATSRSTKLKILASVVELVSKELNHLAAILHVYARGLNFMK